MNKMFLKILVILGLIAPVCVNAMKRVDSPGVAQRKLNLLIKEARDMNPSERRQALADLSPSLREDYEEAIAMKSGPTKEAQLFENVLFTIGSHIDEEDIVNSEEELFKMINEIGSDLKFSAKNINILKNVLGKRFAEKNKTNEANEKLFDLLERKDQAVPLIDSSQSQDKAEKNLSSFLEKLKEYFDTNLSDKEVPYKVNTTQNYFIKNRFDSGIAEYSKLDTYVNNFFMALSNFSSNQRGWLNPFGKDIFYVMQDAFIKYFFPLINELRVKLSPSLDVAALRNGIYVIDKANAILDYKFDKDTIKSKVFNGKSIGGNQAYFEFMADVQIIDKNLNKQPELKKDLIEYPEATEKKDEVIEQKKEEKIENAPKQPLNIKKTLETFKQKMGECFTEEGHIIKTGIENFSENPLLLNSGNKFFTSVKNSYIRQKRDLLIEAYKSFFNFITYIKVHEYDSLDSEEALKNLQYIMQVGNAVALYYIKDQIENSNTEFGQQYTHFKRFIEEITEKLK